MPDTRVRRQRATGLVVGALTMMAAVAVSQSPPGSSAARESAYRGNNLGVAYLEQYNYDAAVDAFRKAVAADGSLSIAHVNLAIALYYRPDLAGAASAAADAARLAPDAPQPPYVLGLVARAENRIDDAMKAFRRVLDLDTGDLGAQVNLGQLHLQRREFDAAIDLFRRAVGAEPFNVTAAYGLAMALTRAGRADEAKQAMARFEALRDSGYGTTFSAAYLEQGRYAEAIISTGLEPDLVDAATPDVRFSLAPPLTPIAGGPVAGPAAMPAVDAESGGAIAIADYDRDGALDVFVAGPRGLSVLHNDRGSFADVTTAVGLAGGGAATGAVVADLDNDNRADLLVIRRAGTSLFRQGADHRFVDVSDRLGAAGSTGAVTAAFSDVDHDGDLDLVLGGVANASTAQGAAGLTILRNNGDGSLTDISRAAAVDASPAQALVPTDFDNRRDVDLLIGYRDRPPALFKNQRDGTFANVAVDAGLGQVAAATAIAAGDVNKDQCPDFLFATRTGAIVAMSDGRARFAVQPAPDVVRDASAAQWLDYDGDGLLDIVATGPAGLRIARNLGARWADVTDVAAPRDLRERSRNARALAAGDFDGDGDVDLAVLEASGGLLIAPNQRAQPARGVSLSLAGRVSNRDGIGTKVDMRAGSLRQRVETYAATPAPAPAGITVGIGGRDAVDVVRALWPSGIVQAETVPPGAPHAKVALLELDRKPSSCPYLFTWNGSTFEFVTDFLGGGEMGYLIAPGVRNHPDRDEYVRIRGDQLVARAGRLDLRITNELEEALYLDRVELVAIDHPATVEVYPNEGMTASPKPERLHVVGPPQPLRGAIDDNGRDVREQLRRLDRRYVDGFALESIRGYARPHALALDLGDVGRRQGESVVLLLTGWTDYAFSSDNVAAAQAGLALHPPSLSVRDGNGAWRIVVPEIGIPVGRPQTVAVDLTNTFVGQSREVRISTTMRIYWDTAAVGTAPSGPPQGQEGATDLHPVRLSPATASLRWRGFSAAVSPDGREPWGYDYSRVSRQSEWKLLPGRYTREGDVRALVTSADDMFVVSRPGDEVAVSFDGSQLPPPVPGRSRTYLLHAVGYSKEMDLNSASPDQSAPLPFNGMTSYPYRSPEAYPSTPAHRDYLERYNTRVVGVMMPSLDLWLARPPGRIETPDDHRRDHRRP